MLSLAIGTILVLAAQFGIAPVQADSIAADASLGRRAIHFDGHRALAKRYNPLKRATRSKRCGNQAILSASSMTSGTSIKSKSRTSTSTSAKARPTRVAKVIDTPAPQPQGTGKVGLDWGADYNYLQNFVVKGAPVYNWTPQPPLQALQYGMNPVPMLWGTKNLGDCGDRCWSDVQKGGNYDTIMGFNEPNQVGQSDISVSEAISLWQQHIEPLATGEGAMRTVSPAVTSAPDGIEWMKEFVNGCDGCHIDVIALHWYATDPQAFIDYVQSFHDAFGKPIWVTEFACQNMDGGAQCSQSDANNFMTTVTAWMDSTDYVERYFAFGLSNDGMSGVSYVNELMDGNGNPTYQGKLFLGWA
jgi:hypothetical protein